MFNPNKTNQKVILLCGGEGSLRSISNLLNEVDSFVPATMLFISEFSTTMLKIFFDKYEKISKIPVKLLSNEYEILQPGVLHVMSHSQVAEFNSYENYLTYHPIEFDYKITLDDYSTKLATICGKNLFAVMLSGRGNKGVEGFGQIMEKGGLVLSELPQESVCQEKPFITLFQNKAHGAISGSDLVFHLKDLNKDPVINYEKSTYL